MRQLSRQNISRQKIGRNFLEPEHLLFEKKADLGQIQIQDLCRPMRIRYHQAKGSRDTTKSEFIIKQGTTMSPMNHVEKMFTGKKSRNRLQYPCYCKGKRFFQVSKTKNYITLQIFEFQGSSTISTFS